MATSTINLKDAVEVKEGVTVYRQGRFRMLHLDTPSAWCATLSSWDWPSSTRRTLSAVYNGSAYVDCSIMVNTVGEVRILDFYGGEVSGAQYGYLINRTICYYV